MSAAGSSAHDNATARAPGLLARWWRRRRANLRNIDHAVWDLRERYGDAAAAIARASAQAPSGYWRRRFWRKVAVKLKRLG